MKRMLTFTRAVYSTKEFSCNSSKLQSLQSISTPTEVPVEGYLHSVISRRGISADSLTD